MLMPSVNGYVNLDVVLLLSMAQQALQLPLVYSTIVNHLDLFWACSTFIFIFFNVLLFLKYDVLSSLLWTTSWSFPDKRIFSWLSYPSPHTLPRDSQFVTNSEKILIRKAVEYKRFSGTKAKTCKTINFYLLLN